MLDAVRSGDLALDHLERRLTAILAADVAGYSRLTGLDEEGTHVQLSGHLSSLVNPKIAEHRGRVVKTTGDGLLAKFDSAVDAVRCAIDIQRSMAGRNAAVPREKRIEFRVGVNVGDIIIDRKDMFGEGVNIAARLEGIATPGGICISEDAYRQVQGKISVEVIDEGEQSLKNIARPIRVYRVRIDEPPAKAPLALPGKPSIAVLPFQNMSGDPEQEYFADGIVEDIITALSRFSSLFVIARNSSFTYKGRAMDVKQVGRELGVRYVLEGSVRKAGNRVRITGQLLDAANGAHVWADRFDGALEQVFDLQDQVTASVVTAIAPKMEQLEIGRIRRKPTESLDAYDYFLRGSESAYQNTPEKISEALRLFAKAIELDPSFAAAYGMAAYCYVLRKQSRWMTDHLSEIAEAERLARRAVQLGKDDAIPLARGGHTLAYVAHQLDAGALFIDRALALNPNLASAWLASGWLRVWIGEPDKAAGHFARFERISPLDPSTPMAESGNAFAHFFAGRYDEASAQAEQTLQESPNLHPALRAAAASNALAGRTAAAQEMLACLRRIDPGLRVSNLKEITPLRRPQDIERYEEGMRVAGLPE